jgi:hypothetical protein
MRTIEEIIKEIKLTQATRPTLTEVESKAYAEGIIDALTWALFYDVVLIDKPSAVLETPSNEMLAGDYRFI